MYFYRLGSSNVIDRKVSYFNLLQTPELWSEGLPVLQSYMEDHPCVIK